MVLISLASRICKVKWVTETEEGNTLCRAQHQSYTPHIKTPTTLTCFPQCNRLTFALLYLQNRELTILQEKGTSYKWNTALDASMAIIIWCQQLSTALLLALVCYFFMVSQLYTVWKSILCTRCAESSRGLHSESASPFLQSYQYVSWMLSWLAARLLWHLYEWDTMSIISEMW